MHRLIMQGRSRMAYINHTRHAVTEYYAEDNSSFIEHSLGHLQGYAIIPNMITF